MMLANFYKVIVQNAQKLYGLFVENGQKKCYAIPCNKKRRCIEMFSIDPTMSFAQVVQYYKDYVKRTKSCGRKPVSFLRFVTGRF
jgi:hypothetical protein